VAAYADAIGVHKQHIWPLEADGSYGPVTSLVADAHAAGLEVHVYTFRNEATQRPAVDATPEAELQRFFSLGVDAVFSDHPQTAVLARDTASAPTP
jgi:glycerophosphoryl diester phosphodiesterase